MKEINEYQLVFIVCEQKDGQTLILFILLK